MSVAPTVESGQYDLSSVVPGERLDEVPAGSNILVAGPVLSGKARTVMQTLAVGRNRDEAAMVVASDRSVRRLLRQYERCGGDPELSDAYAIDCSGTSEREPVPSARAVEYVSSPHDLTGIGVNVAKLSQRIGDGLGDGLRIGVVSLSTLLRYATERRTFAFTHVMTGRISSADYLGVWQLDTNSHDPRTVNTMMSRFDYVVEYRETDAGERQMRVRGGDPSWRVWTPY